jgi:uncharacterized membrane protein YkoI
MKKTIVAIAIGAVMPTLAAASAADLSGQAHITMPQARAIALKAFAGRIVKEELEQEKGGSGLRYSFDIAQGKTIHEVGVDAKTGKVLENGAEAADKD